MTGYTAVLCVAGPCHDPAGAELTAQLRDTVRAGRHGVLVVSGCTIGRSVCRSRPSGAVLVVQPCDDERRPLGHAVHVGPIGSADIDAVSAWLAGDPTDPAALPARLTGLLARAVSN